MVTATFGTIDYKENGVIVVPVNLSESVIINSKTIFEVTHVPGASLQGINYRLIGEDTDFELVFEVPVDRVGSFQISGNGTVLKASDGTYDTVSVMTPITVAFNSSVPAIVDFDVPANYAPGENFDVKIAYNTLVTGFSDNNVQDLFILEGAANMMGTPTPYKWTGTEPSDLRTFLQTAAPPDLTGTNWQGTGWQPLESPPPGVPTTADNDFDENGFWHGDANKGKYFLVRFTVQEGATGVFSMTPRVGVGLRGPVS